MSTFSRYIRRVFFTQFALLLVSFTALMQLFDLLSNSIDVIQRSDGRISGLGLYAVLRLPEIVSFLIPFVVLLAALMTLGRLERDNEILAFKASGAPYNAVLLAFLPSVALVALFHFALADQIVPRAINAMVKRDIYVDKISRAEDSSSIFIQDGKSVIEVGKVQNYGSELRRVKIYERGESGVILAYRAALVADYDTKRHLWVLHNVWTTSIAPDHATVPVHDDVLEWQTSLTPTEFSNLIELPQAMPLTKIWSFATSDEVGVRPTYFYEAWLQKRFAIPVSSILMILLAAPVAHSVYQRGRGLAGGMAIGFILGFLYFVADGLVMSLGESGAVPPVVAAWMPILVFASIGGAWLIRLEGY
ncbi:MAG TPA: LptF/LptG family permease [Dongiaceae bacterium]|jgi:lipopolysaccharide export system permease protein|nr:LptF/LptG family permease [Dongiaceae bacterium]